MAWYRLMRPDDPELDALAPSSMVLPPSMCTTAGNTRRRRRYAWSTRFWSMNGRDFTQLAALTPGFAGYSAGGTGSLNGTRFDQINWQIKGIDNNDIWANVPAVNQGGVLGIAGIILPIDSIGQFSVQTQASPEAGRNPGGVVNLGLRSGTNQFHGSAYYFNRNEAYAAGSPFLPYGQPKLENRNYNAGGSFGAPIIKDKLFSSAASKRSTSPSASPAMPRNPPPPTRLLLPA